jgi:hypothetical protein
MLSPLVTLALYTGLRRSSLFALTVQNTSVETGIITLERTKNGSRLTLPLVGEALIIARELCITSKDGYLFPRGSGAPWNHYRRAWDYAVARAHLRDFTFYDLRHCTASYLIQSGVSLYVGEHSVILTSHRCLPYNQQANVTASCHTRSHPWERRRLSRSRRSVQANSGMPCAGSFIPALPRARGVGSAAPRARTVLSAGARDGVAPAPRAHRWPD